MSLTIKKIPTVLSIHQMDEEEDPKFAGAVRRCCKLGKKLPTLTFAPESARDSRLMKKVRSFGSFDDLRVPDIDGYSNEETGSYNSDSDSFSGGGYVQDVSPFDRILLAAWEDRFAAGLFRYDVTACKTKVVPGGYGFVAQFNEGRATKKRPTEFAVDEVVQAFDGGKFNFTKADKAEILFAFERGDRAMKSSAYNSAKTIESSPNVMLINVSPIEYGHVLLCPRVTDCLPQRISPELLLPPLYMAAESRNPYFRVGYNSLGAYATINHLHFQAYYLMEAFPIERAQTTRLPQRVYKKRHRHGVAVNQVTGYPVRCLCFERKDATFEALADLLGNACERLQERNIPFNLLIADHGARVFLIPQVFSHRVAKGEIPTDVAATGVNPAVFEISGHLLYKQQDDYDACTQDAAFKMLACASLGEEEFYETCSHILAETESAKGLSDAMHAAVPESNAVVPESNATTEAIDIAARKHRDTADADPGSPTSPPLLSDGDSADGVVPGH